MAIPIEFQRNLGFMTEEEQYRLGRATLVVAGVGGDGGLLAIEAARMGVGSEGGKIILADPEEFGPENTQRQAECSRATIGTNKAAAIATAISLIYPKTKLEVYREGITKDNIDKIVEGADLILDETEFTTPELGVMIARAARKHGVPNQHVLNVGWGAQVTSYKPHEGLKLEERLGLDPEMPLEKIALQEVGLDRWLAWMPPYVDGRMLNKVMSGEKHAPSVAPGVAIAAGIGAVQLALHLWGGENNRPLPVYAPHTLVVDAMTAQARVIEDPEASFAQSLHEAMERNAASTVPLADY